MMKYKMIYVNFQNELFIIVPKIDEKVYYQNLSYHFYGSAMNHLELGIWVGWWVSKQISTEAPRLNDQAYNNRLIHFYKKDCFDVMTYDMMTYDVII